jgi:transcription initiation factor IIF auxiliary subunit
MALKIKNKWNYGGNGHWKWEAFIDDNSSGELNDVEFVEYVLHPTFYNPIRRIQDKTSQFKLETEGWGTFRLKAFVQKKDGTRVKLEHDLELYQDPKTGTTE